MTFEPTYQNMSETSRDTESTPEAKEIAIRPSRYISTALLWNGGGFWQPMARQVHYFTRPQLTRPLRVKSGWKRKGECDC
jgi:hypothetical protein